MDNTDLDADSRMQPDERAMEKWDVEPATADQVAFGLGWAVCRWRTEQQELAALCVDEPTAQRLADALNGQLIESL